MDNEQIETMAQVLETVGISIKQDGEYRSVDDVMGELWDKWHSLMQNDKQRVAKAFVRYFL
ncbi:hypothetical protein D7X94_04720 [Acutalibacter sp. 1XD8-33]|uniref:hypothetical protein n=1 Tax=Acutalibacter sp. 1XD8-33 TaxID=2320081 RepID=UPI000EA01CEF|nr:hypothetical protein [Acutalibacter sp. 1XD8-33]RKJ41114.1 hypothetical protein D7X94_04720 [Acutalibacter sp. 1XD8-33]